MEPSARNRLLLAAGIVLVLAGILAAGILLSRPAGPVNPAIVPGFYMPPGEGEREDILGKLGKEQYLLIKEPALLKPEEFPDLSQYTAYGQYLRRNSSETYGAVSWYFPDRESFSVAQNRLLEYLERTGTTRTVTLDLSGQIRDFQKVREMDDLVYCPDLPRTLAATAYAGTDRCGYFIAVIRPLNPDHEDYIIAGYLAMDANLSARDPFLRDLVARGYYNFSGSSGGLERQG